MIQLTMLTMIKKLQVMTEKTLKHLSILIMEILTIQSFPLKTLVILINIILRRKILILPKRIPLLVTKASFPVIPVNLILQIHLVLIICIEMSVILLVSILRISSCQREKGILVVAEIVSHVWPRIVKIARHVWIWSSLEVQGK